MATQTSRTTETRGRNGNLPVAPIALWRASQGLTQEAAAEVIGVHRTTLASLETWKKPVGKKLAAKVAPFTGQTPGEVMDEYERMTARRKAGLK